MQPRAQPVRAKTEVNASAPTTRRVVRAIMQRASVEGSRSGFGLRTLAR